MPIVDTGQVKCSDNKNFIQCPAQSDRFYGQDAQYQGNLPAYQDNHDGTITDLVTGLMWSKGVDERKLSLTEARRMAKKMELAGFRDWRVPNIKELYSLINFAGDTGSPFRSSKAYPADAIPFINTDYFNFRYGNTAAGERYIDAQWLSSTQYVSTTMDGMKTLFGVNFADGRIKGYGYQKVFGGPVIKKFYVRYVRGTGYGINSFVNNRNGTVTDTATGLMWEKGDSGKAMTWSDALLYAERKVFAGYDDWRLPNAKELQYIVDYTRSPDTTNSPAIDPIFETTSLVNEAGQKDFPYFWTSTTHYERSRPEKAVYISFGRAIGQMRSQVMDVHGAGAQRSDPKLGHAQLGRGPQGDAIRIKNYVRLVRGGAVVAVNHGNRYPSNRYPNQIKILENKASTSGSKAFQKRPPQNQMQQAGGQISKGTIQADFIRRHDRNGDSKVSKSEFGGPPDHFSQFDRNKDGFIEQDEAPTGPPPGMGRPRQ